MKIIFTDKHGNTTDTPPTIDVDSVGGDFMHILKNRKTYTTTARFLDDEDYKWLYGALFG